MYKRITIIFIAYTIFAILFMYFVPRRKIQEQNQNQISKTIKKIEFEKMKKPLFLRDLDDIQIVYNKIYSHFEYFSKLLEFPFYIEEFELMLKKNE